MPIYVMCMRYTPHGPKRILDAPKETFARVRDGVEAVILALPGTYSGDQLGLLLGIAQACGMPVRGMVDSAVAAASAGA